MLRGYARVSSVGQDLEVQLTALRSAGAEKLYQDKLTGTTTDRPGLKRLMREVEPGDSVLVYKLDRIARSTRDALNLIHDLTERQVGFKSLNEGIIDTTAASDPDDIFGQAMRQATIQIMAAFAEMERALIIGRTKEGRRVAKANGKRFGRKPKLDDEKMAAARKLIDSGEPVVSVARSLGVARQTLYRWLADTSPD